MFVDYYEILRVKPTSTLDEIKRAYRERSKEWHPDVNKDPSAEVQMKLINEAYYILRDSQKRERYNSEYWAFKRENEERRYAPPDEDIKDEQRYQKFTHEWYSPKDNVVAEDMDQASQWASEEVRKILKELETAGRVGLKSLVRQGIIYLAIVMLVTTCVKISVNNRMNRLRDSGNKANRTAVTSKQSGMTSVDDGENHPNRLNYCENPFSYKKVKQICAPLGFHDESKKRREQIELYFESMKKIDYIPQVEEMALQMPGQTEIDSMCTPIRPAIIIDEVYVESGIDNYMLPHIGTLELTELDNDWRADLLHDSKSLNIKITDVRTTEIVKINGRYAFKRSHRHKHGSEPTIRIEEYVFPFGRLGYLVETYYPVSDSTQWAAQIEESVESIIFD